MDCPKFMIRTVKQNETAEELLPIKNNTTDQRQAEQASPVFLVELDLKEITKR